MKIQFDKTAWNIWDQYVQDGYDCFYGDKGEDGLKPWNKAWEQFQILINQQGEKVSIHQLMKSQNYMYAIDGWIQDYEMELGNAHQYEEKIAYCKRILALFDWTEDDDSCFKCGIADALFYQGKKVEAFEFYERWLGEDSQNSNGVSGYTWILQESGEMQKAYEVARKATWEMPCNADNSWIFMRAKELADQVGNYEESKWYQEQVDKVIAQIPNVKMTGGKQFAHITTSKGIPIVKEEKIYPNDPCPCGSGKKYKKCCGKN